MMKPLTALLIGSAALGCIALTSDGPWTEGGDGISYARGEASSPADALGPVRTSESGVLVESDEYRARQAVERALPFLEQEGIAWMDGRVPIQEGAPCVSCHHVPFAVWSHAEAERAGVATGEGMDALVARAVEFVGRPDTARALNVAPLLLGGAEPTQAMVADLLDDQTASGKWRARGQFPSQRRSTEASDVVATLWSLSALGQEPGHDGLAEARAHGLEWLRAAESGDGTEELATRLVWAGRSSEGPEAERRRLLAAQNSDGGWPWAPGEPSNAFSTGQALYALGLTSRHGEGSTAELSDTVAAGRDFLLRDQGEDGTWHVDPGLISTAGSEEMEVIYRYWGTAWAVIGLARSL